MFYNKFTTCVDGRIRRKDRGLTEEEVLKIAREGRKAHRAGKTKEISFLAECLPLK